MSDIDKLSAQSLTIMTPAAKRRTCCTVGYHHTGRRPLTCPVVPRTPTPYPWHGHWRRHPRHPPRLPGGRGGRVTVAGQRLPPVPGAPAGRRETGRSAHAVAARACRPPADRFTRPDPVRPATYQRSSPALTDGRRRDNATDGRRSRRSDVRRGHIHKGSWGTRAP